MRTNLRVIFRYFFFWILFFGIERLVFVVFFVEKFKNVPFAETLQSFFYGLRLDLSAVGYLSVLPLVGFIAAWNIGRFNIKERLFCLYIRTFICVSSLITVINLNIYREWGSKVNSRAFEFLVESPGEALASSASSPVFLSLVILGLLIFLGFRLSTWLLNDLKLDKTSPLPLKLTLSVVLLGLNFLAIRGGWQLAPVNESMAYYSTTPILNHAAINTDWSLLRSLKNRSSNKNPYQYFPKEEASNMVRKLYPPADGGVKILSSTRPNIILIIQESLTADVIESLGGEKGIDPQIENLRTQAVFFDKIYASGDRTDKGLVAILSGFPSQATESIIKDNSKNIKLPSIYESLAGVGYQTSFYYGGESEFANMKSYFLNNNCQQVVDKSSFDPKDMNSKWGAYDEAVYDKVLQTIGKDGKPFFSTVLTLTNHEPFELPVAPHFKGSQVEQKFKSTAYYADSCLGDFIEKARKKDWYKNTLFIVVADHGHRLPLNRYEIYDARRFRIPLLFFGEVISPSFRGTRIDKVGSQTDIAAMLLRQLGISYAGFGWSKDLLNPDVKGSAFFCWDNGFGFVDSNQRLVSFDNVSKKLIYSQPERLSGQDSLIRLGKAYMQTVYQQYVDY